MQLDERIRQVEARLGKRLTIRTVRLDDPDFRARVRVGAQMVVIEYVEELPGYFWGYELLEELLDYVDSGGISAVFDEGGIRRLAAEA